MAELLALLPSDRPLSAVVPVTQTDVQPLRPEPSAVTSSPTQIDETSEPEPPPALVSPQADPPPLNTVETLFFYAANGEAAPLLFQVNLLDGTPTAVTESPTLFPTALSGLFATEPTSAPWLMKPTATPMPDQLSPDRPLAPEPPVAPTLALAPEPQAIPTPLAPLEPPTFTLVVGSDRKNFLIGTDANNALFGLEENDLILVGEGNNLAFGGKGNDTLLGGASDDLLFGGPGNDSLEGGAGDDTLFGGEGNDILYGGAGSNGLIGGAGADIFRLGKPGAYALPLVGEPGLAPPAAALAPKPSGPDIIVDFSLAEGDIIDLSLIAAQPLFAGSPLLPFVSLVQVGSHTHLQVTSPLGQTTTEAILLNVEAHTLTPAAFSVTPPDGLPAFK